MKKLGIIGAARPEVLCRYYRGVIKEAELFLPVGRTPEVAFECLDLGAVLEAAADSDPEALVLLITRAAERLAAGGAQLVAMAGMTAHLVLEPVRRALPELEVVSVLDPVADLARRRGWRRVGLLAGPGLIEERRFFSPLEAAGLSILRPGRAQLSQLRRILEREVELGLLRAESQHVVAEIARGLCFKDGAEALLLAHSDLPAYLEGTALPVEAIDPLSLHVDAIVRRMTAR